MSISRFIEYRYIDTLNIDTLNMDTVVISRYLVVSRYLVWISRYSEYRYVQGSISIFSIDISIHLSIDIDLFLLIFLRPDQSTNSLFLVCVFRCNRLRMSEEDVVEEAEEAVAQQEPDAADDATQ